MKHILVITLVVVFGLAVQGAIDQESVDKFMLKLHKLGEECAKEIHPSDEELERLVSKKLPETHEGKCMVACVGKRLKVMDDSGKHSLEAALAIVEPVKDMDMEIYSKIKATLEKCATKAVGDADPCVTAYNHLVCTREMSKEMGIDESMIV